MARLSPVTDAVMDPRIYNILKREKAIQPMLLSGDLTEQELIERSEKDPRKS
ncbi:hypothetical protein K3495_g15126 [Podosphaera aphanis]|nr:hypothetical protein K3495_g15126 [Podosphaera aphanis]